MEEHPLNSPYTLWFMRRTPGGKVEEKYENNIKMIATFSTVEGFWRYYNNLMRPADLPSTSDYHMFREGIKPIWEDPANAKGGKWMIRLKKGLASKYWEDLMIAMCGEQFEHAEHVCGAVVSVRYHEDIVSLWTKDCTAKEINDSISDDLRKALDLPASAVLEFKAHDASLRDKSSFRNTDVFR
eukprot:CAMPEP_0113870280 /NCGR_PEP_ID=MMETSP0780_2-20120614/2000_1 /TAXON_ID=652834 /ORGANISM="Palpitomonas bilix" /LENGTH=183 /DNA_ID=CAMNT_0000855543 /DNA_START=257 /DNA_END=808 /DNA_ORIENTATION=+ /assembly_acc=CAM_ASM_000599